MVRPSAANRNRQSQPRRRTRPTVGYTGFISKHDGMLVTAKPATRIGYGEDMVTFQRAEAGTPPRGSSARTTAGPVAQDAV